MSTLSSQESKNVFPPLPHDQMADCPDLTQTCAIHADLISNLEAFYRTLIDLDYLREGEVQFPPHTQVKAKRHSQGLPSSPPAEQKRHSSFYTACRMSLMLRVAVSTKCPSSLSLACRCLISTREKKDLHTAETSLALAMGAMNLLSHLGLYFSLPGQIRARSS